MQTLLVIFFVACINAQPCPELKTTSWDVFSKMGLANKNNNNRTIYRVDESTLRTIVAHLKDYGDWHLLPKLCTTGITDMSRLFRNCATMNEDISMWDVSDVVNMDQMFDGATSFNQYLGRWNVRSVSSIQNILSNPVAAHSLNPNFRKTISEWLLRGYSIHFTE